MRIARPSPLSVSVMLTGEYGIRPGACWALSSGSKHPTGGHRTNRGVWPL